MRKRCTKLYRVLFSAIAAASLCGGCGGEIGGLGDNTGYIQLSASRMSLPADNMSTCAITAEVADSAGSPALIGTAVSFTTNLGRFGNGRSTHKVTTKDESGVVIVTFIAGNLPGTATITASAGSASQKISILVGMDAGKISLTADPQRIPPDGSSSSAITATIVTGAGDPVPMSTPVSFSTTRGLFKGGTKSHQTQTMNDSGQVTVALISGRSPGTALVRCTVGGVSQSIQVEFTEETPESGSASLTLTAVPDSISADGRSTSTITATVTGDNGSPVPIGTEVHYATTLGTFPNGDTSYTATTTDENGSTAAELISESSEGTAVVEASSIGLSKSVRVEFIEPEN